MTVPEFSETLRTLDYSDLADEWEKLNLIAIQTAWIMNGFSGKKGKKLKVKDLIGTYNKFAKDFEQNRNKPQKQKTSIKELIEIAKSKGMEVPNIAV